jgi:hypothetical protein
VRCSARQLGSALEYPDYQDNQQALVEKLLLSSSSPSVQVFDDAKCFACAGRVVGLLYVSSRFDNASTDEGGAGKTDTLYFANGTSMNKSVSAALHGRYDPVPRNASAIRHYVASCRAVLAARNDTHSTMRVDLLVDGSNPSGAVYLSEFGLLPWGAWKGALDADADRWMGDDCDSPFL